METVRLTPGEDVVVEAADTSIRKPAIDWLHVQGRHPNPLDFRHALWLPETLLAHAQGRRGGDVAQKSTTPPNAIQVSTSPFIDNIGLVKGSRGNDRAPAVPRGWSSFRYSVSTPMEEPSPK